MNKECEIEEYHIGDYNYDLNIGRNMKRRGREKISGVYIIRNIRNGKTYIGISENVMKRFGEHRCELRGGYHHSQKLQEDWNLYPKEDFIFEIIEEVTGEKNLEEREKYYIKLYDSCENGYNSNQGGYGLMPGKMTEEARQKISNANKGRHVSQETRVKISKGNKGKKASDEAKKHMSDAKLGCKHPKSVFSEEDIREIRYKVSQGHTQTEVAKAYGVSQGEISNIVNGKRYNNVS